MPDEQQEVAQSSAEGARTELIEDVSEAVETLEEDAPPEAIQRILQTPQGRAVFQQMLVTAISVHEERHSGPLPAPRQLREYETIVPGGAERIFQMAEREQLHRHERDRHHGSLREKAIDHVRSRETRGQLIGGALAAGVLILAGTLVYVGQYGYAVGACASTMVAIAAVFVTRQKQKSPPPPSDDDSESSS